MHSVNLRREICIFVFGNDNEFEAEKSILHHVVAPQLRKFCIEQLQTDFVLIDPTFSYSGVRTQKRSFSDWSRDCDWCHSVSDGPGAVLLLGEKLCEPKLPQQLQEVEYQAFLAALKRKNDPLWTTLQRCYTKQGDMMRLQPPVQPDVAEQLLQKMQQLQKEIVAAGALTQQQVDALFCAPLQQLMKHLEAKKHPADHCIAFARVLKDVKEWAATDDAELKEELLDHDSFGQFSTDANERAREMREEFLQRMPKENYVRFSISSGMLSEYKLLMRNKTNLLSKLADTQLSAKDTKAATYLTIFAKQSYEKLKSQILKFASRRDVLGLPLQREIATHRAIFESAAAQRSFHSRERELKILQNYVASRSQLPGLIFGDHGAGKSSMLRQLLLTSVRDEPTTVVIKRSCGKTPASATLQQLISSITEEIHSHLKLPFAGSCEYAQVVYDFSRALQQPASRRQLIIVLDNIDLLYPQSHTELFRWLPPRLPIGVKILMTASAENFLTNFKRRFDDSSSLSLSGLPASLLVKELPQLLAARNKSIGDKNRELASSLLQSNSYPLLLQLLADVLPCREDKLPDRVKLLFMKRLEQLEQKHSQWLSRSVLSYLSCARFGLSLPELLDVMSLDNSVAIDSGFDGKNSSFYRVAASSVLPLLHDISQYLLPVLLDDRVVYTWRHEVLRSAVVDFYQLSKEQGQQTQQQLSEYWSGRWAGGKAKPLIEKSQVDGDDAKSVSIDRIPLQQPFSWRNGVSNNRKICEMPHSQLKAEKISELYRSCLFSYDYLYAKIGVSSINDLISECYFLRQNYEVRSNQELEVLIALLRLLAPTIENNLSLLGPELAGRLCHLAGTQPLITALLQQIDSHGSRVNCLTPVLPAFPPVEVDEIKVPLPNPDGRQVLCSLSPDNRFLATLLIIEGDLFLYVWDAKSATKSQILNLGAHDGSKYQSLTYMPQTDELLLLEYRRKIADRDLNGFHLLNLSAPSMETRLEFRLSERPKIAFLTKSCITLRVDGKYKVYHYSTAALAPEFKNLHWPFLITQNDKYAITPKAWKADSGKMDTSLRMLNTTTGDQVCAIACPLYATCLLANSRNDFLYVGCKNLGLVLRFDIGQAVKRDIKKLAASVELNPEKQENLSEEFSKLLKKYKSNTSVTSLVQSIDEKYLIVEYNLNEIRTLMAIWSVAQKCLQCVLPQVANSITRFSVDGAHVCQFVRHSSNDSSIRLFNCSSGEQVLQVQIGEAIQDLQIIKDKQALLVTQNRVSLASLKSLAQRSAQSELQVSYYGTSLQSPHLNTDLNVIYDNNKVDCNFTFINLDNGNYFSHDMSHTSTVIDSCPLQRQLTPDGEKLLLVFKAKRQSKQHSANSSLLERQQTICNLRKPELPDTNYFTGLVIEETPHYAPASTDDPYLQLIIRVLATDSGKLLSQISITGERVSHVTASLLLTTRPDHASSTRASPEANDIISVYDLQSGEFLQQVFLQHKIIASQMVDANSRLLICCGRGGSYVKALAGQFFDKVQLQLDVCSLLKTIDEYARIPCIKDMLVPEEATSTVLLHFVIKDNEIQYAKVDLQKAAVVSSFTAHDYIRDVSLDGRLGIDRGLRLYDLNRGDMLKQFSMAGISDLQQLDATPKFICDASLIAVLDNALGELIVVRNDQSSEVVGKAILHRLPAADADSCAKEAFRLQVSHSNKALAVLTNSEFKVFVVKDEHLRGKRVQEQAYHSVPDRCRLLVGLRKQNPLDGMLSKKGVAAAEAEKEAEKGRRSRKGRSPKVAQRSPVEKGTPTRR